MTRCRARRATRALVLAVLVAALTPLLAGPAGAQPSSRVVVDGLEFPAGIAFDRRGAMYVTERPGRIRVVRGGRLRPRPLATVPTTDDVEMGLLGVAVSPDDRYVYAFATRADGSSNEIVRVARRGGDPDVVVEGIPAAPIHNGGGVAFGRDGSLFVSNGETGDESLSQSPEALGGKVYRFTASGDVPRDNPFGGPAFAIGLRNPYGLAVDPVSGDPFVTENGPEAFDEINRVPRGANLGWPVTSGPARGADVDALAGEYVDPVAAYSEIVVPTGIAFADPRTARRAYRGDLFFATYGEQAIHRLRLNDARTRAVSDDILLRAGAPVIALAWGPEGLYYSTPTAVHVVPLARAERPRPSPEPPEPEEEAETPAAQDEPPRTEREPESSFATIALRVAIAAALIGALLFTLRPRRRR